MPAYVYDFSQGSKDMRDLLGGKGANLAEMTTIGLPVPDGFTITTKACLDYLGAGGDWPEGLRDEVAEHLAGLETRVGKRLGDPSDPLLVSVRSGAPVSMPGMMDTILNLGLNDRSVEGLATQSGDERFAFDSYRRFVQMFGDVVMGVDGHLFEAALDRAKRDRGVREDVDLDAGDLRKLVETFRGIYRSETGEEFPQDPAGQLARAVEAVFGSWNTPRAVTYRRHEGIADDLGTAVNVVQMVFGNMGPASATGVAFTRNPSTGERELYGEFLVNAQGEDVVAGIRTPRPLAELEQVVPEAFTGVREAMDRLEAHYKEMQDVEFTIEQGTLYVLQTRSGKRTAQAAVRVARDLVTEGVVDRDTAIARIDPGQLDQLLHPGIDPTADYDVLATGLNASPGAAVGKAVFDADTAESRGRAGEPVILVRFETTPDDIHGVIQAQAVVTAHGGMTSHAAVVARGMGKPCVCGVESLQIDPSAKRFTVDGTTISEGDEISVDGGRGLVIRGAVKLIPPQINEDFRAITGWADEIRRLGVRANADTPEDAARAREFGAEGIGLCRTEHMFFGDERLPVMREMILASAEAGRRAALERLLPFQQSDFEGILGAMAGYPVTIRLLDPPLHEFLPSLDELGPGQERVRARVKALQEVNPMLGTRGCRLGLLYPEIYEMQVRAIVRAALAVEGARVEIMHPLIAFAEELRRLRELTEAVIAEEGGDGLEILIGSMIEVPRAALLADRIARHADFFSFGTNDLTQTALAFSRDDAEGKFLTQYLEDDVISRNPFETMDDSVRDLVTIATAKARSVRPGIKLGICGEHGGDPDSIAFCNRAGLDYVSCSPFRVPIARLASAQAVLADGDRPAG
ncbi:MAG TPA: pyruvate, phosphate dikinase [Gaiellales bacterium]|nr:pyruvate, phosphate dikinase [Gaiellales bacterium]